MCIYCIYLTLRSMQPPSPLPAMNTLHPHPVRPCGVSLGLPLPRCCCCRRSSSHVNAACHCWQKDLCFSSGTHTFIHTLTHTHTRGKVLPINILIFMANKFTSFALRGHFFVSALVAGISYFSWIKGFKSNAINLCQTPGELYAGFGHCV